MTQYRTGQSARQGKRGKPALVVLVLSVGLMLGSLFGLMMWQGANAPFDRVTDGHAGSHGSAGGNGSGETGRASSANSGGVPAGNPSYPQPAVRSTEPGMR